MPLYDVHSVIVSKYAMKETGSLYNNCKLSEVKMYNYFESFTVQTNPEPWDELQMGYSEDRCT